ncbi:MAG: O-antigen ligase family protein [Flavobacteriia bacterium]|nr:O-antigen ligase family protein [Flavobacteriia bacterium]
MSFILFLLVYLSRIIEISIKSEKNNLFYFRKFIIYPFLYYIFLNFIFWLLNLKFNVKLDEEISIGKSLILSNFGFQVDRVNFAFSNGVNSYAVILGSIMTFFSVDIFLNKQWSLKILCLFFIVIICVLLTDARGAIVFPLIISLICYLFYYFKLKKIIKLTPLLFILLPIFAITIVPLLSNIEMFNQFSRNDTDLFTLNGRLFIWLFSFEDFMAFKIQHLFGYGFKGHVNSGVSQNWAFVFATYSSPETVHPHNSILSIIFDIGYLGLITMLIVINKVSKNIYLLYKISKKEALTFFAMLLFIIFISITESFLNDIYMNTFNLYISFFIYIIASEDNKLNIHQPIKIKK